MLKRAVQIWFFRVPTTYVLDENFFHLHTLIWRPERILVTEANANSPVLGA